jgi:hypothetical protein
MLNRWLATLERRFSKYALPNLTYPLVGIMGLVFVLLLANPTFDQALTLDRAAIARGQVWRLVTFVFLPPSRSVLWILFALWTTHTMGTWLEARMGTFRYQSYWLLGWASSLAAGLLSGVPVTNEFLLTSMLLAFGTMFPDFEFMVLFVIPVKVKWLAWMAGLLLLARVGVTPGWARVYPALAVGNYLAFFGADLIDMLRAFATRGAGAGRREKVSAVSSPERPRRVCAACGVTDEDRSVDFRVCTCARCEKPTDYCLAHARNH